MILKLRAAAWWSVLACACASMPSPAVVAQARERLHQAMAEPVTTRDQRDQLSRLLLDNVERADLERMNLDEVQAQFGHGNLCRNYPVCAAQGFGGDDLYYPIGVAQNDKLKQLPTLVFGFDAHGRVKRVFTLRTH